MPEETTFPEQPAGQKTDWRRLLNHKWVAKNIPFFLFLAFLAVLYIYNGHYADKMVRRISASEKHIKDLEFEYKTVKKDVIFRSKASELVKAVASLGLKELTKPPIALSFDSAQASTTEKNF
jgi:hypothetical protein